MNLKSDTNLHKEGPFSLVSRLYSLEVPVADSSCCRVVKHDLFLAELCSTSSIILVSSFV